MNELNYKKSQVVVDKEGTIWVLVDIVEIKSLLNNSRKPEMIVYLRPKSKKKITKATYSDFLNSFTPFHSTDKSTIDKIISLEQTLSIDGLHPTTLEN